jgi:copper resistance protein C
MRTLIIIASIFVVVVGMPAARAHAHLDHATPPAGATVAVAPDELSLSFTQGLEPAFSTVEVTGPNGERIDQGKPQVSGNTMRIGIKAAGPGNYHVQWRALSVDTHATQGSYTFHVGQ